MTGRRRYTQEPIIRDNTIRDQVTRLPLLEEVKGEKEERKETKKEERKKEERREKKCHRRILVDIY